MRLHAELRRKQSEIQDENCIVTDIIELPESEYASLYQNLLRERGYLAERANMESFIDGQRCCVLVLGEGQEDGILVDSQGSSYARRSAFVPEARAIVRNHIRQLADYVVSEGTEHTEDGRWANTYDELYYHFGANITDKNGNGKLLREELQRRDEVNELIMTEDCIEINYHLAYCQNCGEGGISGTLDLLSLLGCNLYDVHFTCDGHDSPPVSRISADMLTEEGKREWADVLSAKVESITFENESFKCKLANCDPERLKAFTEMLNGQCDLAEGSMAVVASAKDEKENMLRLAERLKADGIKTMLISDPSRISLDPNDFIEIVSAFHKNGVTIEYQDGDGNTRNLLEVLEQFRTAPLDFAEPECDEDEEPDESPHIQM